MKTLGEIGHSGPLCIPDINKTTLFNSKLLQEAVSIESWIVPLIAAGHVSRFIWVKSPWSDQFETNKYENAKFGFDPENEHEKLVTNICEEYFLTEAVYREDSEFSRFSGVVEFQFEVCGLEDLNSVVINEPWILDIDLDFYTTQDPFRVILGEDLFEELKSFYPHKISEKTKVDQRKHLTALTELNDSIRKKWTNVILDLTRLSLDKTKTESTPDEKLTIFINKVKNIENLPQDFDEEMIISAGASLVLPHHVSTPAEITYIAKATIQFLESVQTLPLLFTMARSVYDEYCPLESFKDVEKSVLDLFFSSNKLNSRDVKWNIVDDGLEEPV